MINTKKTFIVTLLILVLATAGLFASGAVENADGEVKVVKVSDVPADFSSLDMNTASFTEIMNSYQAAVDNYTTKAESIMEKMVQSYNEGNVDDYFDAKGMLRNLEVPMITAEQTEILAQRLSDSKDQTAAAEFAAWLYENSMFYSPQITLTKDYPEDMGIAAMFGYKYVISTEPGSTVTLPSLDIGFTSEGVFAGWGVTEDKVTYQAGDEITMPYSDLTLYAIFKTGVLFSDSVTGTEVFEEGTAELVRPFPRRDAGEGAVLGAAPGAIRAALEDGKGRRAALRLVGIEAAHDGNAVGIGVAVRVAGDDRGGKSRRRSR